MTKQYCESHTTERKWIDKHDFRVALFNGCIKYYKVGQNKVGGPLSVDVDETHADLLDYDPHTLYLAKQKFGRVRCGKYPEKDSTTDAASIARGDADKKATLLCHMFAHTR